jgi:integrase
VTKKLTTAYLKTIGPKRGRATRCEPDGTVGGLSIRYGARGHVEFSLVYRFAFDPSQYRRTLGYWWNEDLGPAPSDRWISLDQARIVALQIKEKAFRNDIDLHASHWKAVAPAPAPPEKPADATEAVIDRYAREHLSTLRTGAAFEKLLRQSCAAFLQRPIGEVARADLRAVLDGHMGRGKGFLANRVHATLSTFFAWALDRDLITTSPMANMARPMRKEEARDRVLNDAELAKVWHAVGTLTAPRRDAIRLMILTGLRRSEASEIRWQDIDGAEAGGPAMLTIPTERAKNNMAHLVPLSPQALAIIGEPNGGERVFDFGGKRADLSTYAAKLAKTLDVPDWRLHDLRRTMASGLQRLGTKPEVIDRCLGHSAVVKGVAAVYMRSQYLPERKAAMELWGRHVAATTS